MQLETKRLLLRPWQESDAAALFKYAKDPRVGPAAGWPPHTGEEESLEIIRTVFSAPHTFAVVPKGAEPSEPIGCIGLLLGEASNLEIPEGEGELGYWIGVPFWGQGLIPEAAREMLRYGFEDVRLAKIWCGYYSGNEKSRRVQEKCGFRFLYTRERVDCPLIGETRTEHISCLAKEDWQKNSL